MSASQAIKNQIRREFGVDNKNVHYIEINSALVSAQNRRRFYVHNFGRVQQPKDRGIVLKDILDMQKDGVIACRCRGRTDKNGIGFAKYECRNDNKANTLDTNTTNGSMVAVPIKLGEVGVGGQGNRIYSIESKAIAQAATSGGWGAKTGLYAIPSDNVGEAATVQNAIPKIVDKYGYLPEMFNAYNVSEITNKSPTLSCGSMVTSSCAVNKFEKVSSKCNQVYQVQNGVITIKDKQYPIKLSDGYYIIRKLSVKECCRLQTMPDNYCRAVSNSQAYKGLGNGWTAEVIKHILNEALSNVDRNEEILVLSMYDGVGTGRYVLDKLGFKNIKYYAYEIDKYAKQIALSNYPDIIQMGDAFAVRENDWALI